MELMKQIPLFSVIDVMKLAKKGHSNEKFHETMVLTAASLTHTFSKSPNNTNHKVSEETGKMCHNTGICVQYQ